MASGILLCGVSNSWQSNFLASIIGLSGVGGTRRAVDATTNEDAGSWGPVILSCIRRGKPFRATIAFKPSQNWITALGASLATWTVTWPVEPGYSAGAVWTWSVGMTDFTVGGTLEDRMLAEVELTPSGVPTLTAGT